VAKAKGGGGKDVGHASIDLGVVTLVLRQSARTVDVLP
jgi:hypothetical protein